MNKNAFLLNERLRLNGEHEDAVQENLTRSPETFKEIYCTNSTQIFTNCASKVGIAVSLIEGMIATARILWMMDLSSTAIQEALKDLKDMYELSMLTASETESPQGRMHDQEWRDRDKVKDGK